MDSNIIKSFLLKFIKKWWCSLLMLPFIIYSIHQIYWALRFNIFFAVNYHYPFPLQPIYIVIDNFLLIIHEAGHTFFGLFGVRFVTILGGSLFQILLPMGILAFCWINRKSVGMQLSCCLIGFSWLDVAAYAADAGARQIPLIGGLGKEAHDWHNLLSASGLLKYDHFIGILFAVIGIIFYLFALLVPLFYKHYETVNLDLKM